MPSARRAAIDFAEHFRDRDPILYAVIDRVGPFTLRPHRDRFGMLVRSIVSQQLSTKAAQTIHGRLAALVSPDRLAPEVLAARTIDELRSVGLSQNKAEFIRDLATKVSAGTVQLSQLGRQDDEGVIAELTQVRGVGRWTAQMFLIFALGRLDVFPFDDLGVRAAMRNLYGFAALPTKVEAHAIADVWRPYASVASWYCWRSLELAKQVESERD